MTRAALYARYSSDNQSMSSIEDQFRICRDQATREKWKVVGTYEDAAISGASVTLRPGIQALLQDAQTGKFDLVLAEALDRISRDQADVAIIYKHLKFAGVRIVTLAESEISELHVGLKGTMNALFLKDLAAKTHRGLWGRVEKGKAGGGLCYGYDVVKRLNSEGEQVRGERKINEAEAAIVRRIFRVFAAGRSPRTIAADLNSEGIPGPFGRAWGDTTIRGHVCRGTGILNNELYAGVLVWNRLRYIKNPATGKRVSRVNPESEWIRTEVPELRIVDEELWQAARQRQTEIAKQFENVTKGVRAYRAQHVNELRRPSFLFSGLLTCGCCGGHYGIITRDRYGCLNRYRRGTCDNGHTIRRDDIESRVLAGLTEKLVSADAVGDAVRTYAEELNRQNHERRAHTELDRKALAKVERGIAGIMAAIEDGMYQPAMKARMDDLERQKAEITARMAEAPANVPDIHPSIAEIYKAKVVRLTEALADPELHSEAADAIRSLVGEVVLTPGEKRGEMQAVLRGELMGILDFVSERWSHPSPEVITKGVAGPRNHRQSSPRNICSGAFVFAAARLTQLQDTRQVTLERDLQAAILTRCQRDPLNHAAHDLHRLGLDRRIGQGLLERRHPLPIHPGKIGVQPHLGRGRRRRQPRLERRPLRLQLLHARLHRRLVQAILDRPDHARDLAPHGFQPALVLGPALVQLGRLAVDLLLKIAGELLDQLGRQQPVLEAVEHAALQLVAPDPAVVVAGPLGAMGRAAVVVRVDDREAAAAHAACQQATQQVLLPVRAIQRVAVGITAHDKPDLRLPRLDGVPERVVDDAQLGHRHDLPLRARVRSCHPLAGAWVLDVRAAVPLQAADIEGVVEQAGAAVELAANRGVAPVAAIRPRHALGIQLLGDRARARAGREQREDALDHRRLGGIDPALAGAIRARWQHVVAVRLAARNPALERTAELPAPGLLGEVFQIHLRHGAEHADMHGRDLGGRHRVQPDAQEGQSVVQLGHIRELAAEPVERLDHDHVEPPLLGVRQHLLERRAKPARAAQRLVGIDLHDCPALPLNIAATDLDLVLDRRLALIVRAVAGIEGTTQHGVSSG